MTIEEMIKDLCALPGPAGFEEPVADRVAALLAPYVDEVRRDTMGNVIGVRRCGKKGAKRLLIDVHMDEIGFIVTGHEDGFLRIAAIGGVDARMLPASTLKILTEPPVFGVVGAAPPHVLRPEDSDKTIKIEELFVDIGLTQEEAKKTVPLGTPAVYGTEIRSFGDRLICGKAMDDRSCLASVLGALELLKDTALDVDLYILASCQEEVGERGVKPAAFALAPDWCIAIDVDHAKTPDGREHSLKEVGGGVVISKGTILNKKLTAAAIDIAKTEEIKYQLGIEAGNTGTNANLLSISREGVPTALLGLPLKYMHSPIEVISLDDAEAAARLLCALIKSLKGEDANA